MKLRKTTYFYTNNRRFEQSLDVYQPISLDGGIISPHANDSLDTKTTPLNSALFPNWNSAQGGSISAHVTSVATTGGYAQQICHNGQTVVLLVVGSGWMGHHWSIYYLTSWWNSSGPRTVALSDASGQTTCLCIRHSGAFVHVPSLNTVWASFRCSSTRATVVSLTGTILFALLALRNTTNAIIMASLLLGIMSLAVLLSILSHSSATHDEMMNDVAQAIVWVRENRQAWDTSISYDDALTTNENVSSGSGHVPTIPHASPKLILGGYSSGGHVVACLLHRRDIWKKHGLPDAAVMFAAVLYISGVLAVQPCRIRLVVSAAATKASQSSTLTASTNGHSSENKTNDSAAAVTLVGFEHPRWLTDLVMRVVWGPHWSTLIPSPIELLVLDSDNSQATATTRLPHLLIGNEHEMFGLTWLDVFFCARAYAETLQQHCHVKGNNDDGVIYQAVQSDHWNILHSRQLRDVLCTQLPQLLQFKAGPEPESTSK